MTPSEVVQWMNQEVEVSNFSISGRFRLTAYIFRVIDNKKFYQAEVQNLKPPHEIYIVSLADVKGANNDE